MKKITSLVFLTSLLLLLLLSYSTSSLAKKRCKPFQKKLHNIQAMQRSAYSLKRGHSLRAKEDKARDKWWQCEKLSLAKFNAKYGIKKQQAKKSKKQANENKVVKSKSRQKSTGKKYKAPTYSQPRVTFNQTSEIVIRSRYQGDKQLAWLDFYTLPVKCKQPKTISDFAYCNEHKRQQQSEFDKSYSK
ncbi:hypothetical protein CWS31_007175 [Colwellia echini]|uniref:Uncharacterized protein n=2 Tax=Colwellia echini TaxID=1982103 RepID=A0ABY3MY75_9GAMM|nr:hypothetical protein CWS31_007175 [Colwellia echini]